MKNTQRHEKLSVIQPPSVGPMIGAKMTAMATTPNALPRCAGSNVSRMIDCWFGCKPPPKKSLHEAEYDEFAQAGARAAQRNDDTVNIAMQIRK